MSRRLAVAFALSLSLGLSPGAAEATDPGFTPGAPGIGDPYFPLDGNGGYDAEHYLKGVFADPTEPEASADAIVTHELAHQWVGDSLTVAAWRHTWLSEGFATYSEWLWGEHDGLATAQENFDSWAAIPADDPFWSVAIGDPGPERAFDIAVYMRGAMTLHTLRQAVGDRDFFRILRVWAQSREGGNVASDEFIALAERISGEQLDGLFATWLFTAEKPLGARPRLGGARLDLLHGPAVAVWVAEVDEAAPGEVLDLGDVDAPRGELLAGGGDLLDDELQRLQRAGLGLGQSLPDRDRAR